MSQRRRSGGKCQFEQLESRFLLSGVVGAQETLTPVAMPAISAAQPDRGPTAKSAALTPAQVRTAYGFDKLSSDGTGQTIAIVDAYDAYYSGTLVADLAAFNSTYGLPACDLHVATPQGTPSFNSGWAQEITLDVEWAHAIAPKATILLIETQSNSFADLFGGIDAAVSAQANVVSMSWGGGEFAGETTFDSHFNAPGITFVASSGDTGGKTQYPAVSPYVVGVGGTSLKVDSSGNWLSETGWSGSGGGSSQYETKPSYQNGVVNGSKRASPDVAYDADPNTGVSVYYNGGWWKFGGTSVGAPQWSALIAIADQGRGSSLGSSGTLAALYADKTDFHDITSGIAGKNRAGTGYDLVTGMGSPFADRVVPDLGAAAASSLTVAGTTGSAGVAAASARQSPFSDGKHIEDANDVFGSIAASVLS